MRPGCDRASRARYRNRAECEPTRRSRGRNRLRGTAGTPAQQAHVPLLPSTRPRVLRRRAGKSAGSPSSSSPTSRASTRSRGGILAFVDGAELVIHNAAFDIGFLDAELARLGLQFGDMKSLHDRGFAAAGARTGQANNSLDALLPTPGRRQRAPALHARCSTRSCWPRSTSR